jgi:hypothetical protein
MKKLLYLFAASTILISCGPGSEEKPEKKDANVWIKGTLFNPEGENVMLVDVNQKDFRVLDSVHVDETGLFTLSAKIRETGVYTIKISDQNFATIVISPGDSATVKADAKNLANTLTISGSEQGKFFEQINTFSKENGYKKAAIQAKMDSIQNSFQFLISKRTDKNH